MRQRKRKNVEFRDGWTTIRNSVLLDKGLTATEKVVYCYLCARDYADDNNERKGECWPSQRTIANDLGLALVTVKNALRRLREIGYISVVRYHGANGRFSSNIYKLAVEPPDGRFLQKDDWE